MDQERIDEVMAGAVARKLLQRPIARLAYVARDGTPRVVPIGYIWDGSAIVMCTATNAAKIKALQVHPDVALTIDTDEFPPNVLLLRGKAELEWVDGIPDEFMQMNDLSSMAAEQREAWEAGVRSLYDAMYRIRVVPRWAKVLDFETTLPSAVEELMARREEGRIRAAGHAAHPITLTGFGERIHLGGPEVNLETHVTDLVNVLHYEDVREAILVGHSYAGMVIAGATERVPERIRHLVFLDAVFPLDGESFFSVRSIEPPAHGDWHEPIPFPEKKTREVFPDLAEEDVRWFYERMTPRLVKPLAQPIALGNPAAAAIPRTYLLCRRNWDDPLPVDILRARTEPGWDFRELDSDHVPMFSRPQALAEVLFGLA